MTDKQLEFEDYYETLGISPNADQETMQAVYRCLAKRYHPDNPKTGDGQRFIRIRKAYRILSDPDRRSQFDRKLRSIGLHGQRWVKAEAPLNIEEDEYLRRALLTMVFKLRRSAEKRWRRLRGYRLLGEVIENVNFVNGIQEKEVAD